MEAPTSGTQFWQDRLPFNFLSYRCSRWNFFCTKKWHSTQYDFTSTKMEHVDTMIDSNHPTCTVKICHNKATLLVFYNGSPSKNYSVILCDQHASESPFNQNILKITLLEKNNWNIQVFVNSAISQSITN